MAYQEKINIYVPHDIGLQLKNDARLFEILKKDKRTINMNRFLSLVLCGYYDDYCHENKDVYDSIMSIIRTDSIVDSRKVEIANQIVNQVFLPTIPKRKGQKPIVLSLKPTTETERIIQNILISLNGQDYISQYFCRMLMTYCRKPIWQRERIVFKENYDKLQMACKEGRSVSFSMIWDDNNVHELIPYTIVSGREEMFNYLIGEGINKQTGKPMARSYRLNRIDRLSFGRNNRSITIITRKHCDHMIEVAPQYAINTDDEICVKLSDAGEKLYNRIYYGRPVYSRIVDLDDGHYYYFSCSDTQIFHYFRRYDNKTAEIISPPQLREKMIRFHRDALELYHETKKE